MAELDDDLASSEDPSSVASNSYVAISQLMGVARNAGPDPGVKPLAKELAFKALLVRPPQPPRDHFMVQVAAGEPIINTLISLRTVEVIGRKKPDIPGRMMFGLETELPEPGPQAEDDEQEDVDDAPSGSDSGSVGDEPSGVESTTSDDEEACSNLLPYTLPKLTHPG